MRSPTLYHVAPRYSAGSPAQVTHEQALHAAVQESGGFWWSTEGRYGADKQQLAAQVGLQGIVYSSYELGRKQYVTDLCTGETFIVPNREWSGQYWYSREDRNRFRVG